MLRVKLMHICILIVGRKNMTLIIYIPIQRVVRLWREPSICLWHVHRMWIISMHRPIIHIMSIIPKLRTTKLLLGHISWVNTISQIRKGRIMPMYNLRMWVCLILGNVPRRKKEWLWRR
jgi:hypothetical protein